MSEREFVGVNWHPEPAVQYSRNPADVLEDLCKHWGIETYGIDFDELRRILERGESVCQRCNGRGWISPNEIGRRRRGPCPDCKGMGKITHQEYR